MHFRSLVLVELGVEHALVVHGMDGLDELSTTGITRVSEVRTGNVLNYEVVPDQFGLCTAGKNSLTGGDAADNADIIKRIFNGEKGCKRDIVVLNAAASLYVGRATSDIQEGVLMAEELLDSGKAAEKLQAFVNFTGSFDIQVNEAV